MEKKIKFIQDAQDATDFNNTFKKGDVQDLGFERNRAAVFNGFAEWVEEKSEAKPNKSKKEK